MKFIRREPIDMPNVKKLEAAPTCKQLYVWLDDGRSGMVDMSEWTGPPCDRWDNEGFNHWRVDAGMPCWGKDSHFSSILCAEELTEMPYEQWLSSARPGETLKI